MLLQNPDLGGIYVTWAGPAEGVLATLRANGSTTTTKIVTLDLLEPFALDMVKGGKVAGIVADEAYELGRAMAAVGARAVLDVENPPFIVAPALSVTKTNVAEGWQKSLHKDAPRCLCRARTWHRSGLSGSGFGRPANGLHEPFPGTRARQRPSQAA